MEDNINFHHSHSLFFTKHHPENPRKGQLEQGKPKGELICLHHLPRRLRNLKNAMNNIASSEAFELVWSKIDSTIKVYEF